MSILKKLSLALITVMFVVGLGAGLSGCPENEGPLERTGEEIDEGIEEGGEEMEDAVE